MAGPGILTSGPAVGAGAHKKGRGLKTAVPALLVEASSCQALLLELEEKINIGRLMEGKHRRRQALCFEAPRQGEPQCRPEQMAKESNDFLWRNLGTAQVC